MQISGLTASGTFSATDVLAIEVNVNGTNKTYKLTGATLAAALASIGSYLTTSDIVNDLTSTATDKPASANLVNGITSVSFSLPSGYSVVGNGAICRVGHIVTFSCALLIPAWTSKALTDISLIPEGFRPNMEIDFAGTDNTNDAHLSCLLNTGGNLSIYRAITTSCTSIRLYATYIVS